MKSLLRFSETQKYLVFDFETENLNLAVMNRPWELGLLVCRGHHIVEKYQKNIWWDDFNISKGAADVTRFNYQNYKSNAEPASHVLDWFEKYFQDPEYIIMAHNCHNFDIYVLKQWREALGRTNDYSYLDRTIDTNSLAKMIKLGIKEIDRSNWKQEMFRFSHYREKGMKTNLTALGKEFSIDVDYESLHSAKNDIILNFDIWNKLKYMIVI